MLLGSMAMGLMNACENSPFSVPKTGNGFHNQNYRPTNAKKPVLREFKVNGKVVMAYSKKDALKRIKRRK